MVATAFYSVTMVLGKETAFPLCRAMEKRWKRNVVSRVSSVIVVIRLPISCVSSMAISLHYITYYYTRCAELEPKTVRKEMIGKRDKF